MISHKTTGMVRAALRRRKLSSLPFVVVVVRVVVVVLVVSVGWHYAYCCRRFAGL